MGCCGPKCENDGLSCCNAQGQLCCFVVSAAFPFNEEVPLALSFCGFTCFPTKGCCVSVGEVQEHFKEVAERWKQEIGKEKQSEDQPAEEGKDEQVKEGRGSQSTGGGSRPS